MVFCLFCDNKLAADTKPEHILLSALGGRMASKRLICNDCNGHFGSTIDNTLAAQVRDIRNMLQFESGKGQLPPTVRQKTLAGTIVFDQSGRPQLKEKPFTVTRDGDVASVSISANSPEQLERSIQHIAAQLERPVEVVRAAIFQDSTAKEITRPLSPEARAMSFGGEGADRSIVKACLTLLATTVGNDEVRLRNYDSARQFVTHSDESFAQRRITIDSRMLPDFKLLENEFGSRFNLIYVRSDEIGRVTGHFTLYNLIGWHIVLAETGGRSNIAIGLASDPSNPARWSSDIAERMVIDAAWLDNPRLDQREMEGRFEALLTEIREASRNREIRHIIEEEFRRHGVREAVVEDDDIHKHLFGAISARVAALMLRQPFERDANLSDIQAIADRP